jgi:hypothetical protein
MIDETIKRIEKTVASNETIGKERKDELLGLISNLKKEIGKIDKTNKEAAASIAHYTESSIQEAVKEKQDSELLEHSLKGLFLSVRRFEVSHPTLIGIINNIGQTLNNFGI